MAGLFEWSARYQSGDDAIDAQHRNLFDIANRLQADLDKGQRQQELMNLYRHMREHFRAEEELMRGAGYPRYLEHRKSHDELLAALNDISAEVAVDPGRLPELRALVASWIDGHVLDADLEIMEHLRQRSAMAGG